MQTHTSPTSSNVASLFLIFIFTCGVTSAELFVFGDSYADTGNHNKYDPALYAPWRAPYGITWPGHPSGRCSDGRVFTDYYARYLNVKYPIPYRVINHTASFGIHDANLLSNLGGGGINFAFGGSGLFPTFGPQYPNISAQIDELKKLIAKGVVSSKLIESSTVLLVVAGNDYAPFLQSYLPIQINIFIPKVVAQIVVSLQELYDLGFKTLVMTNLEPLGCLPYITYSNNYTSCIEIINDQLSIVHNTLLASSISTLKVKRFNAKFILLDLYNAFKAVMKGTKLPLKPCCVGVNGTKCGDIDSKNGILYTLCLSPQDSLFWDYAHPSNAGWKAISKALLSTS